VQQYRDSEALGLVAELDDALTVFDQLVKGFV